MPLPSTMIPIATNTLSSASATVTFSNIPQNYTDLVVVFNGLMTGASGMLLQLNSDTGANYSDTIMYGTGSAAVSMRDSNVSQIYAEATGGGTTNQHTQIFNFQNYSNTTTYKTVLIRNAKNVNEVGATVGLWRNTGAITTIRLFVSSNNFSSGSTFTLYGIKAAS